MAGIVGYGASVPLHRIKVEEIASTWGQNPENYKKGLQLTEKSVPAPDQDTISLSVEAARKALTRAKIDPKEIGAVYVGSESHPYAVKPTAVTVAEALGVSRYVHCADFEFACKAGSESMFVAYGLVKAGLIKYGLGIGGDTSQGAPGDALEYSAAAGAAAFLFGNDNVLADVNFTTSYTSDTPDFWRREYMHYPRHAGRFTGEPAYFTHVEGAGGKLLEMSGMKASDFAFAVFHQPNGKFPMRAGKRLGFTTAQMEQGWLAPILGNTYSGASPLGLSAILDVAKPGDKILMVSYGSGSGSDGFIFTATDKLPAVQKLAAQTREQLSKAKYISYGQYAKFRHKIRKGE